MRSLFSKVLLRKTKVVQKPTHNLSSHRKYTMRWFLKGHYQDCHPKGCYSLFEFKFEILILDKKEIISSKVFVDKKLVRSVLRFSSEIPEKTNTFNRRFLKKDFYVLDKSLFKRLCPDFKSLNSL